MFVFFPYDSEPLDNFAPIDDILIKLQISHQDCKSLLSSLYRLGIRFSNLYPELTSVSKDILLKSRVYEFLRENSDLNDDGQ